MPRLLRRLPSPRAAGALPWLPGVVVLVLLLAAGQCNAQADTVGTFKNAVVAMMNGVGAGFSDYYSAMSMTPQIAMQFCSSSFSVNASGMALAMEKLSTPYGVYAAAEGLVVYKPDYVFGPTVKLIGVSANTDGTLNGSVQEGSQLLFPYKANTAILVTGTITANGATNFLPMARYLMVDGVYCAYLQAEGSNLITNVFSTVWAQLA